MENCVHIFLPKLEKVRVVTYNGEILEFKGLTKVKKITTSGAYKGYNLVHHSQPFSPLSSNAKLEPGEVYYLVPDLALICPKVVADNCTYKIRQKIKIVVTREQLEYLLLRSGSSKQLQSKDVCVRVSESFSGFEEGRSPRSWRPSLASIEEAKEF
ncbi:hypothetical protein L484_010600 [Morus notabilis]|uniref:DUF4228 domain-containing protein n=1 Tax=Morus notabilis TaxID=981085 RepID=W9QL03_9ROSA|nr:hypothetical protein L484_010600 [Morus notabilis]